MKTKIFLIFALLSTLYFSIAPTPVSASLFEDFLNEMNSKLRDGVEGVKDFVAPKKENKTLTLDTEIKLAEGGDVNKNGQIDAGDTITFTYTIQNLTDRKYTYANLKTNVQRNHLNSIDLVEGVTGLKDDGKTIEFPNLRIEPGSIRLISFMGRVNYFTDQDPLITTEPELESEDKQSIVKSGKQQILVKKIRKEDIPHKSRITKKDNK